jgi:formamidopyrimidine-DNA glycosylase
MPELPEVETVRRTLHQLIVGKRIERVTVRLARIIQYPEPEQFSQALIGQTFREVGRRGKFLRFRLDDLSLISHLRMEGRYGLYHSNDSLEAHTHVIFHFDDQTELRYKDVRQFGTMHLFPLGSELERAPLIKLGVEPLDPNFTLAVFKKLIMNRSTKIKPLLLNQEYIVGIGNIYVDESLFRSRIHPERTANSLSSAELKRLHHAIVDILSQAVEAGGSSIKSYVNGQGEMGMFQQQLHIYGLKDKPCSSCGRPIEKMVVAGRGTHYCSSCQRYK